MFKTILKEQEQIVNSLKPRCENICSYMYPLDEDKSLDCIEKCSEQNRNLFRMENISKYALVVAISLLCMVIFFTYKIK